MADTDEKKAKKAEKPQRPAKGEQVDKPAKAQKAAKGEQPAKAAKSEQAEKTADGKGGKPSAPREPEPRVPARLKVQFEEGIRGKLAGQFGYKNRMQIPVVDKIVINMGIGEGVADRDPVVAPALMGRLVAGR